MVAAGDMAKLLPTARPLPMREGPAGWAPLAPPGSAGVRSRSSNPSASGVRGDGGRLVLVEGDANRGGERCGYTRAHPQDVGSHRARQWPPPRLASTAYRGGMPRPSSARALAVVFAAEVA